MPRTERPRRRRRDDAAAAAAAAAVDTVMHSPIAAVDTVMHSPVAAAAEPPEERRETRRGVTDAQPRAKHRRDPPREVLPETQKHVNSHR